MATADWYFDFVSPFAYLQSEQLALLGPKVRSAIVRCCSRAVGRARAERSRRDRGQARVHLSLRRLAGETARNHAQDAPEHPFNPLPLLRLAIACDCSPEAVHRISVRVARRRLPDLPIEWASSCRSAAARRAARIAEPEVKDALRRNTDEAIARGVFGVPTLAVGDQLFWGADATQMAADYIAAGQRWTDPEYERVAALPVGAARSTDAASGKQAKKR